MTGAEKYQCCKCSTISKKVKKIAQKTLAFFWLDLSTLATCNKARVDKGRQPQLMEISIFSGAFAHRRYILGPHDIAVVNFFSIPMDDFYFLDTFFKL